jgi:hypothetical protein
MINTICAENLGNNLESIPAAESGLYILMFLNSGDKDIYDNNIGREKIVVYSHSTSIKSGKFERGLGKRLSEYKKHLHIRKENDSKEFVFSQCFYRGFVFDTHAINLGVDNTTSAKIFENYWNCCLLDFLKRNNLIGSPRITQSYRSEWWYLEGKSFSDSLAASVKNNSCEVARKIANAAEVLRRKE